MEDLEVLGFGEDWNGKENKTLTLPITNGLRLKEWRIAECIYFGIITYIYISVLIYELEALYRHKTRKKTWTNKALQINPNAEIYSLLMRIGTGCAIVTCLILRIVALIKIFRLPMSDLSCDFATRCKPVFWTLTTFFVYFVLWCRQRCVYNNPSMEHITNKFTRFLSVLVAIVFVPTHITNGVLLAISQKGVNTPEGCKEVPLFGRSLLPVLTSVSLTLVAAQLLLMLLLAYPLVRHVKRTRITSTGANIWPLIKRTCLLSIICVVTDAFGPIGIMLAKDIQAFKFLYFGASLIVDIICININFSDWKERLLPFYRKHRNTMNENTSMSTRRSKDGSTTSSIPKGLRNYTIYSNLSLPA